MTTPDLLLALQPLVDAFAELGVAYFIGGSVASSAYGLARSTLDIDVIADLGENVIDVLVDRLRDQYYIESGMIRRAVANRAAFNIIHLATMMKVDVFILKNTPYDRIAFQRRRVDTLDEAVATPDWFLASPEDVVLHKLWWFRLGGEVSERQWSDVLGVLRVQERHLDFEYLHHWAGQLELADLLRRALEQANLA
jgi:hypothetical protein